MGKITGFMEYDRLDIKKRTPKERLSDYKEQSIPYDLKDIQEQAARCMSCGIPFCHGGVTLNRMASGCPLHNLIPEWNDLVYHNQWHDAYLRLAKTNPFPEFTSRVCPAPCEGACTNGLNFESVTIKSIEYEIINRAFKEGWVKPDPAKATKYKVAIIGSGPAGLSAAHYLAMAGHAVTVYEKNDRPGGLLMYGIPNMKLDKDYVMRRKEILETMGVTFKLSTAVGTDVTQKELQKEFDAILIATGAEVARDVNITGRDLDGIQFAVPFLAQATKHVLGDGPLEVDAKDKDVIIIGGGDTGTDCVATSLRMGCKSVTQLEIMPEAIDARDEKTNPWPEWPKVKKVDYGQEEAIEVQGADPREYLINSTEFIGKDGSVKAVKTTRIVWENVDGRFTPVPVPGTEKEYPADLVLLAVGFVGTDESLLKHLKVEKDPARHNPMENLFDTNQERVFIAGDARRGQSLVVTALQEGKLAAKEIDAYLMTTSMI